MTQIIKKIYSFDDYEQTSKFIQWLGSAVTGYKLSERVQYNVKGKEVTVYASDYDRDLIDLDNPKWKASKNEN
jgi:hypothetical protein